MKLEEFYIDGNYTKTGLIIEACELPNSLVTNTSVLISSITVVPDKEIDENKSFKEETL